jgi:hypothetical protein
MSVQRFAFFAHNLTEPLAYLWAVHVVVVNPAFISGVIGRVYVYALDLACKTGK